MIHPDFQRRLKRHHQKVRTGCSTCKRRRIKCDEHRPICGACERSSRQCEYVELKSWIFDPVNCIQDGLIVPKLSCGPSPLHLPVTKESLDFRFFLEHSVPLLCTVSDDWDSQIISRIPSLFVDGAGKPLVSYQTTAFGRFWSDLVPKIAYNEPVIYKLLCMYASRHRAAICSSIADNPTSTLEYYGKAIKKLSSIMGRASPDITITGAMILFAFDRMVSSIDQTSGDGFTHVLASLNLMMQYPSDMVQDFLIPVGEHFASITAMFQQHCAALHEEPTAVENADEPYLPQSFTSCEEASQYFFVIVKTKYPCACLEGAAWTSECGAFQRQQNLLREWKLRMQQYYQSLRGTNFEETRIAFTLLAEVNLIIAAASLSANEEYGTVIGEVSSIKSTPPN